MNNCGGWARGTEFPLGVEEEHNPGVGCMMKRVSKAPTGKDNYLGGERGGVGKDDLLHPHRK